MYQSLPKKKKIQTNNKIQTKQLELLKQIVIKKIRKSWQIHFTSSYYNGLLTCVMESHPLHLTVMAVTKSSQYMRLVCEKDKGEINKSCCALQLWNSCINCAYIIKQSQLSSQKLIYLFAFSFCQHKYLHFQLSLSVITLRINFEAYSLIIS